MNTNIIHSTDSGCNEALVWPNYPVKVSVGALSEWNQYNHVIEMASLHLRRSGGMWLAKENSYMKEYMTV